MQSIAQQLAKPVPADWFDFGTEAFFDPWEIFPCLYGSYSCAFDNMAIEVLERMRDRVWTEEGLAHEMFREMLCTSGLADYGMSPRGCFPEPAFEQLLPALIDKWKLYRKAAWGDALSDGM